MEKFESKAFNDLYEYFVKIKNAKSVQERNAYVTDLINLKAEKELELQQFSRVESTISNYAHILNLKAFCSYNEESIAKIEENLHKQISNLNNLHPQVVENSNNFIAKIKESTELNSKKENVNLEITNHISYNFANASLKDKYAIKNSLINLYDICVVLNDYNSILTEIENFYMEKLQEANEKTNKKTK